MNKDEIKKNTDVKIAKIKALAEELKLSMSAENVILENGIIKTAIYYVDMEDYSTPVKSK